MSSLSVVRLLGVIAWACLSFAVAHAARAGVFDVDSTLDHTDLAPGDGACLAFVGFDKEGRPIYRCTLRAAVQETNALPGADEIVLAAETYVLTRANEDGDEDEALTGDLDVLESLEILGVPGETVIDVGGLERAFFVYGNRFPPGPHEVRLFGVEIRNGDSSAADGGGALWNFDTDLSLDTVSLKANRAPAGGALLNQYGRLSLIRSTVSGNEANSGAAIYSFGDGAEVQATNVTVSGNGSTHLHPGSGGGGIVLEHGVASLLNVTIHDNEAAIQAGGLWVQEGVVATIRNVVIAGNRAAAYPDAEVESGAVLISDGGNLFGDGSGSGLVPGVDQVGSAEDPIDPRFGPLADNGGYNETHAPLPGSPAIDRGNTSMCPPLDQRFEARPLDGDGDGIAACDVGAVEYAPEPAAVDCAALIGVVASLAFRTRRSATGAALRRDRP